MNLRILLFLPILLISINLNAKPDIIISQQNDSTYKTFSDSIDSLVEYQNDFITNAEVEHQKLMRNIFAVGFVIMLGLLVFTVVFYGRKIKKVSSIIMMQNEVLSSTKDQLIKIINIFNFIDRQVYITDAKGNIEWHNTHASNWFIQDYEKEKISLINKFSNENKGIILQGINEQKIISFDDKIFDQPATWKMIPIKNSKDEFANMVFIGL